MIEQMAGIVAVYGLVFGILWKLESFIVKRTDVQISEMSKNYNAWVISNDLKKIKEEIKEKKEVKMQVLDSLVQDVNRSNELKGLREEAEQQKKQSFIYSIFSITSTSLWLIDPMLKLWIFTPDLLTVITSMIAFSCFYNYYCRLNDVKKNIEEMDGAIQNAESLRF